MHNATDLGIDLDRIAARRAPRAWNFLDGCRAWIAAEDVAAGLSDCPADPEQREAPHLDHFRRAFRGTAPCPNCGGATLKDSHYCTRCNQAGLDGAVKYPGEPVGSRLNEGWEAEPTRYRPNGKLRGGKK